jgi:Holliday junction DNA helicase RuvA
MIYFIKGELIENKPGIVILDVGGIGYQVYVPQSLHEEFPSPGVELLLYTYLHVREDELTLYGFRNREMRSLFLLLLGVSGIGPKVALNVIATLPVFDFVQGVLTEDYTLLTEIPGVGLKTAQRLVLELKDKVSGLALVPPAGYGEDASGKLREEAAEALLALGYSAQEAASALKEVASSGDDLGSLVKKALRYLGER